MRAVAGPDGVSILEAGAGTGKTTTARALVETALISRLRVIGLAPSWVAADELARSTGIPAQAIARWRHDQARELGQERNPGFIARQSQGSGASTTVPSSLDWDTLVIVDEAGMVSTRDLEAILSAARAAGAKVVLIGDRRQLASVAGASALRAVTEVVGRTGMLGQVRRQEVDWQRAASMVMASGDAEAGLRAYAARGHIDLVSGAEAAQTHAIALWSEARTWHGADALIVTRRNADAAALNLRARTALREEGVLGPDLVTLPARDRADRLVGLALAVGDSLRFGESLTHLGIRNGNRARIEAILTEPDDVTRLRLSLEDGRVLDVSWQDLARRSQFAGKAEPPKIVHAYAGTVHATQGRTGAAAILYVAASLDAREVYVGLTRHRFDARVVVERDRLDAQCRQRQADPRLPPTNTAILERLFGEARSYREKVNVADYATDRVTFVRDGSLNLDAPTAHGLNVSRAVRAARALRGALASFGTKPLPVPVWQLMDAYGRRLARASVLQARGLVTRIAGAIGRTTLDYDRGGIER